MSVPNGDSRFETTIDHPCEPWCAPDEMVRGILSTVLPEKGNRALVVVSGSDDPSRRLAEETGAEVLNIDVHPPGPALPVGGDSVDQVWCLGATTHVEDLAGFAEEVTRVLRSGGRVLVADTFWDGFRPPRFADQAKRPWHAVATKSVVSLLACSGLTDLLVCRGPGQAGPTPGTLRGRLRPKTSPTAG